MHNAMKVINLEEKFGLFNSQWDPKIIAQMNGQDIKLAKVKGEFVWHQHDDEDELFFVVKGTLRILFRDGEKELKAGEMLVVPKGIEHKPVAAEEVLLMLSGPTGIKHTGDIDSPLTVGQYERI